MREQVRVSMGTLRVLGMELVATDTDTTTAYLQTYHPGKCLANCRFCAQARDSMAKTENIARGLYPPRDTQEIVSRLSRAYNHKLLKRVCIQTMNYPGMFSDLTYLVSEIGKNSDIPLSVSVYPLPTKRFIELKEAGADRLTIPLDAATKEIFCEIKGKNAGCRYTWQGHVDALFSAVGVFGRGRVGTHLIVGLGETEQEAVGMIQMLQDKGIHTALFAYTQVPSSQLQKDSPEIGHYRRIQITSYLMRKGLLSFDMVRFRDGRIVDLGLEKNTLEMVIDSGRPFCSTGCKDCNRPYSTEVPGGLIYNYPRKPAGREIDLIKSQLGWRLP